MKAAVLRAIGQALSLEQVPEPTPGPGEVLVKTAACGICGTDLHIAEGWGYTPELPFIMGHEPAGVIAEVGEGVTGFAPGDRVVPNIFYACGACVYCQSDRETQCLNLGGILGVLGHPGGYGECFAIPARQVFRLPEEVSFAEGGVIADAVVTAVHAAERGRVREGETAVIVGVGGVGAAMLQVSQACGARTIAVEISDRKVTWARDLGADEALNARAVRVPEAVREMTDGLGAQVVFDCVGSAQTLRDSLDCLANGGRLVIVGYTQERYPVDPRAIAVREIEVLGSRSGSRRCTAEAIRRVSSPSWKPIVSDRFPLEQVNEALEFLREGGALGRIVLTHGQ